MSIFHKNTPEEMMIVFSFHSIGNVVSGKIVCVNQTNPTRLLAVVASTNHPNLVCDRCVIDILVAFCIVILLF